MKPQVGDATEESPLSESSTVADMKKAAIAPVTTTWMARLLIVAALSIFFAPWTSQLPHGAVTRFTTGVPAILEPAVAAIADRFLAGICRLGLFAIVGAAFRPALGVVPRACWSEACALSAIGSIAAGVRWPGSVGLVFSPVVVAVGLWGWWAVRLWERSFLRMMVWVTATAAASLLVLRLLVPACLEEQPLVVDVPSMSKEDRARLEGMLQVAGDNPTQPVELRFDPADLTGMVEALSGARSSTSKVNFIGIEDRVTCEVTHPVSTPRAGVSYLNIAAEMKPRIAAGRFDPGLTSLRIGGVTLPEIIVIRLSGLIGDALRSDPETSRLVGVIDELSFADGSLIVVADVDRASSAFAESMATSSVASDRMRSDVREIMQSLVDECASMPVGDDRFSGLMQAAFRIAQRRTQGGDAGEQNKAAIIALGIQIGDPRLRRFAGFSVAEKMVGFPWDFDDRTTLRGRNDLARHFLVSAALRALSTKDIGLAMGLFKEQLDAVDGGTGFSFSDIAADMAGVRFAEKAIDPQTAATMQEAVQGDASADSLLPSIDGLADNLTQQAFESLYGGVTDERYLGVIRMIHDRMESRPHLATGSPPDHR